MLCLTAGTMVAHNELPWTGWIEPDESGQWEDHYDHDLHVHWKPGIAGGLEPRDGWYDPSHLHVLALS